MRTLATITTFILFMYLSACRDDTRQLLKSIDGHWSVSNITFTNQAGKDSTVTTTVTALEFDVCSTSTNGGGPGNCQLYYSQNNERYNFTYQATDGKQSLSIIPTVTDSPANYQQISTLLAGSYSVILLTDNALTIRKKESCAQQSGNETCSYITFSATR